MTPIELAVLRAMKASGHRLIDDMVEQGMNRSRIYALLAHRLQLPPGKRHHAHFGNMRRKREVERAIAALEQIRMEYGDTLDENLESKVSRSREMKRQEDRVRAILLAKEKEIPREIQTRKMSISKFLRQIGLI